MKKLLLLILLITAVRPMQSQHIQKQYIEVTGSVKYQRNVEKYIAKMVISPGISYDTSDDLKTLKERFFQKLKKAGIAKNKLTENKFGYAVLGYKKKGTMYVFETVSKEDFITFLNINASGTIINSKYFTIDKRQDISKIAEKTIENANVKAAILAAGVHKKLGEIIAIIDKNVTEINYNLYNDNNNFFQNYEVRLRYELLN